MSTDDIATILLVCFVFGGPTLAGLVAIVSSAVSKALSGRRALAVAQAQIKALKAANRALTTRSTVITDPRLEALLWRVQATDEVHPQLPQDLRDDIDATLAAHRPEVWLTEDREQIEKGTT